MFIPTKYKSKLPNDFSYPIGAELISEVLVGVPQFEKLVISFSSYHFAFTSDFQRARKEKQPYQVFRLTMTHILKGLSSPNQFIEDGFYNENWEIHIYPVPRKLKSVAKELLLDAVLPQAKEWMEKPRTEIWLTGRKEFKAFFKENESQIFIEQD